MLVSEKEKGLFWWKAKKLCKRKNRNLKFHRKYTTLVILCLNKTETQQLFEEKDTTLCFLSQNLRILVQTLNKKTKTQKHKNNTKNPIGLYWSWGFTFTVLDKITSVGMEIFIWFYLKISKKIRIIRYIKNHISNSYQTFKI
jgi:hypothetical protein